MKKEIKIGLFAVLVLAVAFVLIEFLKGKDIFSRNNTFHVVYPTVEGISPSTSVTIGGYAAGIVSDLSYNTDTRDYTVTFSISKDFTIPKDSRIEVYSSDLLGTKKLRVVMGDSPENAESGDTLSGSAEADMLSSLAGSIQPAMLRLDTLLLSLGTTVESINMILDETNRNNIRELISNLNSTSEALKEVTSGIRDKNPEIAGLIRNLNSVSARLDSASRAVNGTMANAETITESLANAGLGETVSAIDSLVRKAQDPDGSVGKLLGSDSLYNALTNLAGSLDSLVGDIRKDPKKYIKISIF